MTLPLARAARTLATVAAAVAGPCGGMPPDDCRYLGEVAFVAYPERAFAGAREALGPLGWRDVDSHWLKGPPPEGAPEEAQVWLRSSPRTRERSARLEAFVPSREPRPDLPTREAIRARAEAILRDARPAVERALGLEPGRPTSTRGEVRCGD